MLKAQDQFIHQKRTVVSKQASDRQSSTDYLIEGGWLL